MIVFFLLLATTIFPLREEVNIRVAIPTQQQEIFYNYSNNNFTQEITVDPHNKTITAHLKNSNYSDLNLDFAISPRQNYLDKLTPELRDTVKTLATDCWTFECYFKNLSYFLQAQITYSEEDFPQSAPFVILNHKANCVGYASLVRVLLEAVGIEVSDVRGFYLKEQNPLKDDCLIPIPHRWLEIRLADGSRFFFDPQYQTFSANYIATRKDVDFKGIKKFEVKIINKSKKIINE